VGHEGAVVKLEKMSVLRQQLHRQLAQLKRTYMPQVTGRHCHHHRLLLHHRHLHLTSYTIPMPQEGAPKKGWFGRDERTFTALPLGGRSLDDDDTLEQRELLALYVT